MAASSPVIRGRAGTYQVCQSIGKGAYGEVFLVKSKKDRKLFVMKNIKLGNSSAKERTAAEQEASLLSKLQHPNIVSYKESFQDSHGILHIVMGYCEGGDLCTRLKAQKGAPLPESQVVEWFVQIALALQYLHERNILHRDLKTQNIFLSRTDIIKVGDLGIARVLDGSCDLAHTVIGTPYYMSPEIFQNQPYNQKSDIWALGCCVYEMATLKHAFTAKNIHALMVRIVQGKLPEMPSHYSADLCDLIRRMLAQAADDRPSVQELLRMHFVRQHIKHFLEKASQKKARKAASGSEKAPSASEISPVSSDHTKQTGDVTRTPSKGENGGSKERSSSVNEEGIQSSASVTLSVEGNRESSPSRDAAAIDKPSVDCEGQCSRVQVDVEVHTVKQNDPEAHTLHPESTLKSPEAQNCQANNEAGASSVAERDDNQRRQDGEVSVNPLCPSQEKTVVDPCRSEVVRTSSTEDVNASVEQTPSTPVCPDGDRNSAVIPGPVKSVDPDNSEDGIYRSSSNTSLSSARERRRKSKQLRQQGKRSFSGCKMVLKSRPSSDTKMEEQECLSPASHQITARETSSSACVTNGKESGAVASHEEVGGHMPDAGVEEVDGLGIPRTQSDPAAYVLIKRAGSLNDRKQMPSSVSVQPTQVRPSAAGTAGVVGSELQSSSESSDSHEKHGSGNEEGGERGSEELDSMLTILDATLLLPPPEEPRETSPTPPREAFVPESPPAGRLYSRIEALKKELRLGLGKELFAKAYSVLEGGLDRENEGILLKMLGQALYNEFSERLRQLKFCEESLF